MKYVSLLILAVILIFAYVQFDINNKEHITAETEEIDNQTANTTDETTQAAGFVSEINGLVIAASDSGEQRTLQPSTQVFVGETIETRDSNAELTLDDGTQVKLRPETKFRIIDFSYKANGEGNTSLSELIKGQLRIITGKIGKAKNDRYQLKTSIATIGIRGTHYAVRLCVENECKIDLNGKTETLNNGLYMGVLEGVIVASSKAGDLEITAGESYFQQLEQSESIKIEPIPGVLFTQETIDAFSLTTGEYRDSNHWIIHKSE